ncbi:flagellar brake protein [Castellaniella ginsengisoli]|uniref:Flagellar brake protein YcgR n=1 Tax=Castellaniella ginsengisoli TaxID=546114 RepID=A0AB39CJ51_9BURK
MAFQEDDPCLVSQPLEISSIVQGLLNQRVLVRLDIPGKTVSIISTLLDVDPKTNTMILDNASEDQINTQLLRAPAVRLQGTLDRVMIEFSGPLSPAMHGGKPALSMAWPAQLRRIQRREFFRVDIPASNPAYCLIESNALPSGSARFRIADISAGGLQLVDHDKLLVDIPVGTIFEECTLELPDADELDVGLRVLRSTHLTQDNGKPQHQVACRYFNLPDSRQITIQQYIGTLERAVLARRWGME